MTGRLKLFGRNVSWLTTAEFVKLACWWAMLVVIGKQLGVEAVGQFGLAIALASPFRQFTNLGLRSAIATDVAGQYPFDLYFALRVLTNCGFIVILLAAALALGYENDSIIIISVYGIYKIIQAQSGVCYGLYQKNQRLDIIAKSILFRSFLGVFLLSSLVFLTNNLLWGISGLVVSEFSVFVLYDWPKLKAFVLNDYGADHGSDGTDGKRRTTFTIILREPRQLWRLALHSFPLGVVGLLGALQVNLPRLIVEGVLGLTALGYFTAISAFYSAFTQVMNALGHSASARLARDFQGGKRRDYLSLLGLIGLGAGLAGLLAAAIAFSIGGPILALLFTADYAAYQMLFGLVMVAAGIRLIANVWQFGVLAARRFWLHSRIHIVVTVIGAIAAALLIPAYGLAGAGYSLIVSSTVHAVGIALVLGYLISRPYQTAPD